MPCREPVSKIIVYKRLQVNVFACGRPIADALVLC
jgi:hypothetical protein